MRFHFIFLVNIFSVSGFKISVDLGSDSNGKPSQGSNLESKDKTCDFPTKSGSSKIQNFPVNFDARKAWPSCKSISDILDDGPLNHFRLLSSVDQMSDLICTIDGDRIDVQLTVDQMAASIKDFIQKFEKPADTDCSVYRFWVEKGIYVLDYQQTDICLPFSRQCKPSFITKDKYFKVDVTRPLNVEDKMKDMMTNGPAIALIEVYKDFQKYTSGIYETRSGELLGVFPFKIIGWGVEDGVDYWLGVNSWGTKWGDKGTFKIRRSSKENGVLKNWFSVSLREQPVPIDSNNGSDDKQMFFLAHKEDGSRYENINGCLVVGGYL